LYIFLIELVQLSKFSLITFSSFSLESEVT
jgi:hypothetical protein